MSDVLIYQTSDSKFADRAIEGLRKAGISCYRIGRGTPDLNATIGRWTDDQVSIYIEREGDARRANDILIQLGGTLEEPFRLPNRWVLALLAAILTVLVILSVKV
jgi:hypothetical protein